MRSFDVLILGAGAAGLMCAAQAGKRGRKVALIDHSTKPGGKIPVSGGGRCNFTNTGASARQYVSENPDFCRSALSRFTPSDFVRLLEEHRIGFHERKHGQLFCDGSARQIVDLLVGECRMAEVEILSGHRILALSRSGPGFAAKTDHGEFSAPSAVVATGGLSIPEGGATGLGYGIAAQFGLKLVETAPALDGFVFRPREAEAFAVLAGVSADARAGCRGRSFRENILFTHEGLSGP
ncbi:MAG: aminoacetone oxidase family FAD-binding enzyme, partial [candidate division NC10 bacterium]